MENIKQTIPFVAGLLLKEPITDPSLLKSMTEYLDPSLEAEKKEAIKTQLLSSLSPSVLKECQSLGVDIPCETINIEVSLGSVLFDLWTQAALPPTPPLANAIWKKRKMALAAILEQENLEIQDLPPKEVDLFKSLLLEEEQWKNVRITGWYNSKGITYTMTMPADPALKNFHQVYQSLGELFLSVL